MFKRSAKQLDKLSQWTGETFFKENKTELSAEFREFEKDVDIRKNGIERLHATSIPYHQTLSKRKPNPDPYPADSHTSKEKLLPGEALGLVMISHGEDLQHAARQSGSSSGQGAKLGEMLERFGRGRCRVSSVQEQYANRLGDGYMAGMENAKEVVSDYQAQRKKLDSRRLALDAIQRKMNSSKKDTSALEEELEIATARYEEAQEDTHSRMQMVQDCEARQMAELTDFLDAELEYVSAYHTILRDLRYDWDRNGGPASIATRPRSQSSPVIPKKAPPPPIPSRTRSSSKLTNIFEDTYSVDRPPVPPRRPSSKPVSDEENGLSSEDARQPNRDRAYSSASNASKREKRPAFLPKFGSMTKKPAGDKYGLLDDNDF